MGNGTCSGDCIPDSYQPRLSDANQSNLLAEVQKEDSFYRIDHPYEKEYRSGHQERESLPFDDMRPSTGQSNYLGQPANVLNLSLSSIKPIQELVGQVPQRPADSESTLRPLGNHHQNKEWEYRPSRANEAPNRYYYQVPEQRSKFGGFAKQSQPQQEDARASKENRGVHYESGLFDLPDKVRGNAHHSGYPQ